MPPANPPPRLHILPASAAPIAVILRRKPSRLYHVLLWHTDKNSIEPGSWFRGGLYPMRSDVSPNGQWMVFLGMLKGRPFNGLCRVPDLTCTLRSRNVGTWGGGGLFLPDGRLLTDQWWPPLENASDAPTGIPLPELALERPDEFRLGDASDLGGIFPRLVRDGYTYRPAADTTAHTGVWSKTPSPKHPALNITYAGYRDGYKFRFHVEGHPDIMSPAPDWACYDSRHQLLIARQGRVERWSLRDIKAGSPGFTHDLANLEPPPRPAKSDDPAHS